MSILRILPSREARDEFPKALKRFRNEGASADPIIFGSHRKPEAVVIPFDLYSELLPLIEELEIARLVKQRTVSGNSKPLSAVAEAIGLPASDYK